MKKYQPAVARGVSRVADKLRSIRIENTPTLDPDGVRQQWNSYRQLPLADRAVWVSKRVRRGDKATIENEMIRFEKEMIKRFGE